MNITINSMNRLITVDSNQWLSDLSDEDTIDTTFDDSVYILSLNKIMDNTDNTTSKLNSLFNDLNLDTDCESINTEVTDQVWQMSDITDTCSGFSDVTIDDSNSQTMDDSKNGFDINVLNEYCFIHLMSFMCFKDLMTLRSANKYMKSLVENYLKCKRKLKFINSFAKQNINIETTKALATDLVVSTNDSKTDQILTLMTQLCPNLDSLEMIYITIDEPIVEVLTKNFYDVKQLSFAHPLGLTEDNIELIVNYFGAQLIGLTLTDCDISEDCLYTVINVCPNLQSLDISGNVDITGDCFEYLNSNLLVLRLSQCDSIQEYGLKALVSSDCRQSLVELVISGMISDYMIKLICESLLNLRSFQCVYGCTRELDSKTDHLSIIGNLSRLEWLSLQEIDAYFGSLDDKCLYNILSCCNRLKYLELHIGSGEPLLVTDQSLSMIANYCPEIECLKIYYFEALTDRTLNSFSKLKHLRELELINLYNITDDGITIITEQCTRLTKLWISFDGNCDSITNITLSACISMCKNRPKSLIEVNFFETCITVPFNVKIPSNMRLRVSWYRPTPEGRRYTEIRLPNDRHSVTI
ncbi:dynein regulatory complex subunit 6-like [Oppia nitens]|uniref:dynein regulatory complex subunit 6-like n=1 Tax=Oppia nitens TaxID=1686743 RepID=UPI0023DB7ADA|nr:dynein regulatory complex subunit 6-like [Oppia nitens]